MAVTAINPPPLLTDGVWSFPSQAFEGGIDYMAIDPERGRIIYFFTLSEDLTRHASSRHWYEQESPGTITARHRPSGDRRSFTYRCDGGALIWPVGDTEQAWTPVATEQLPERWEERLAQAHAKMDAEEASVDISPP